MKKCYECGLYSEKDKECKALKLKHFKEYLNSENNQCKFYKPKK